MSEITNIGAELYGYIQRGVDSMSINGDGELVVTLTDGTTCNLGVVKGDKGDTGDQGEKGEKGDVGETGPASAPTLVLKWYDSPTESQKMMNTMTINSARSMEDGSFHFCLQKSSMILPAVSIVKGTNYAVYFLDTQDPERVKLYFVSGRGTAASGYRQGSYFLAPDEFDPEGSLPPSMYAVANYVDEKIAEALGS